MELVNATKLVAGYTMSTDKTGREWLVVVAKGTFGIPDHPDLEPQLLEEQVPLVMTDIFTGEPGFSAPLYEIDYSPRKPRCDVLLNGSAYAPGGRPATKVQVTMQVGSLTKSFNVFGKRVWQSSTLSMSPSAPEPFTVMPISYGNAFGGIDKPGEDPNSHVWYPLNPAGVGYHPKTPPKAFVGKPLPNTEEISNPVSRPDGSYKPMAFGPLGRSWQPRIKWGGTYDKKWIDEKLPFLPDDFDDRYFQCAAEDQQTEYLDGGEEVILTNLTKRGRTAFKLPVLKEPFDLSYKKGEQRRIGGTIDTLVLEPDLARFTLSLRLSFPLRRNLHEISQIAVGRVLPERPGADGARKPVQPKPHYKSLRDAPEANRRAAVERDNEEM